MKKLISVILAIVMLSTLCVMASADETGVEKGTYGTDVTGTYVEGTVGNGIVYSVDIQWSDMSFTYHSEKAPVWDVTDHTYSEAVPAYWEGSGNVTVTNHSNISVEIKTAYTSEDGYEDAKMLFTTTTMLLDSAANGNEEKVGSIEVTPSGFLPENTENQKIGSINVIVADGGVEEMTKEDMEGKANHYLAVATAIQSRVGDAIASSFYSDSVSSASALLNLADDEASDIADVRAAYIAAYNASFILQTANMYLEGN